MRRLRGRVDVKLEELLALLDPQDAEVVRAKLRVLESVDPVLHESKSWDPSPPLGSTKDDPEGGDISVIYN